MPTNIVRVYATEEKAAAALRKLEEAGFAAETLLQATPETEDVAGRVEAADMRRLAGYVGDQVAGGRSVVAVRPPFGRALLATRILDEAGPLAVEPPQGAAAGSRRSAPAPLSDTFGWEVLSDKATPLSDMIGLRVLSNTAAPLSAKLGWSTRARRRHFLTSKLSNKAAPLSSAIGLRLLSNRAAPLSERLGWSTLAQRRHFLTSELSSDPAPLSSALGLRVLSEKQ